jgi:serine/threonine-protein kinase
MAEIEDLTGETIGNYKVLEKIGGGGFGNTYKAKHNLLNELVCIKHQRDSSRKNQQILIEEAKSIWDLRHFGIPSIRDVIEIPDKGLALIMSYIQGKTLEKIMEKTNSIEPENVAWITERSLNVLKYLHYHGVVHGDVKPTNIIIQADRHSVVLVDYGLSISHQNENKSKNKGYTKYFAPPEQLKGDTLIPESDFYGLGMTMIYALGGNVSSKKIPESTPVPLTNFIKQLILHDPLSRPNWRKQDLCEEIQKIRLKAFGRKHSGMKKIGGIE